MIDDCESILRQRGRTQRGIDGYTSDDLRQFRTELNIVTDEPKYGGNGNIVIT